MNTMHEKNIRTDNNLKEAIKRNINLAKADLNYLDFIIYYNEYLFIQTMVTMYLIKLEHNELDNEEDTVLKYIGGLVETMNLEYVVSDYEPLISSYNNKYRIYFADFTQLFEGYLAELAVSEDATMPYKKFIQELRERLENLNYNKGRS